MKKKHHQEKEKRLLHKHWIHNIKEYLRRISPSVSRFSSSKNLAKFWMFLYEGHLSFILLLLLFLWISIFFLYIYFLYSFASVCFLLSHRQLMTTGISLFAEFLIFFLHTMSMFVSCMSLLIDLLPLWCQVVYVVVSSLSLILPRLFLATVRLLSISFNFHLLNIEATHSLSVFL